MVHESSKSKFSPEELQAIIDEATADCYDFEEELSGWESYLEDELVFPFEVLALGKQVQVTQVEERRGRLKFVTRVEGKKYWVEITDAEVSDPTSKNARLLAAYRLWLGAGEPEE